MSKINIFRYPGGKSYLIPYIKDVVLKNDLEGCDFIEPFAGSAAVSTSLLSNGIVSHIHLIERDPLLYSFWYCLANAAEELCARIRDVPVTLRTWEHMSEYRKIRFPSDDLRMEMGLSCIFLNRTNYSGILAANPLGGRNQTSKYSIDCRFNKEQLIENIKRLAENRNNISVYFGDAIELLDYFISCNTFERPFFYIDPPYYVKGKSLYRYSYNVEDHINLSRQIDRMASVPWLISYDDHPFIHELYAVTNSKQSIYIDYQARKHRKDRELLISNLSLPPIDRHHMLQIAN